MRFHPRQIAVAATGLVLGLVLGLGVLPATYVNAQSLKEMRARDAEERALQREAAFTARICGASLSASIDWSTFDDWPDGVSVTTACDGALAALEAVCREGRGRGGAVSSFVCAGDGTGASFSGGEFTYGASPGESSFDDAKSVLDDEL